MSNLSKEKRDEMLAYLNHLKEIHTDDESRIVLEKNRNGTYRKKIWTRL